MEMAEMSEDEEAVELIQKRPVLNISTTNNTNIRNSSSPPPSKLTTLLPSGIAASGGNKKPIGIALLIICVIVFSTGFSLLHNLNNGDEGLYAGGNDVQFTAYHAPISRKELHAAISTIDSAMARIHQDWRVDEYPIFKSLLHIPESSWELQVNKLVATMLRKRESDKPYKFIVVFTGSSVTAGHDSYVSEMFSSVFNDIMTPVFDKLNMELETRNVAIGNNPCIPYDACVAAHSGYDADIIAWEQSMNCGRQPAPVEFFIRNSFAFPKKVK